MFTREFTQNRLRAYEYGVSASSPDMPLTVDLLFSNRNTLHQVPCDRLFLPVVERGGATVFVAQKILHIVAVDTLAEEVGRNRNTKRVTGGKLRKLRTPKFGRS